MSFREALKSRIAELEADDEKVLAEFKESGEYERYLQQERDRVLSEMARSLREKKDDNVIVPLSFYRHDELTDTKLISLRQAVGKKIVAEICGDFGGDAAWFIQETDEDIAQIKVIMSKVNVR